MQNQPKNTPSGEVTIDMLLEAKILNNFYVTRGSRFSLSMAQSTDEDAEIRTETVLPGSRISVSEVEGNMLYISVTKPRSVTDMRLGWVLRDELEAVLPNLRANTRSRKPVSDDELPGRIGYDRVREVLGDGNPPIREERAARVRRFIFAAMDANQRFLEAPASLRSTSRRIEAEITDEMKDILRMVLGEELYESYNVDTQLRAVVHEVRVSSMHHDTEILLPIPNFNLGGLRFRSEGREERTWSAAWRRLVVECVRMRKRHEEREQ